MNIGYALLLPMLAGLCTAIGSLISLFFKDPGPKFLSITLGFSAGVMILVSFVELLQHGIQTTGFMPAHLAFFTGFILTFLVDILIPHDYLAEHYALHEEPKKHGRRNMARTGLFVAIGITLHNFPEGLAVFAGSLQSINLGIAIAVAIALHNIPEGIAVSVPVYAATRSRRKAFWWSFLSGLAEPIGALIALLFLLPFLNPGVIGLVLSAVAGIMVFISIDELVPVSRSYGEEHLSIVGLLMGMLIMSFSLYLMGRF